jgi:1,2-dihydroxy-3-keto-5-methylthiopentene dioxygenase
MTALHVFQRPQTTDPIQSLSGFDDICTFLSQAGIVLERWDVSGVDKRTDGTQLLAQFHDSIEALKQREGYQSADVIALTPDHKDRIALRENSFRNIRTVKMKCVCLCMAAARSSCLSGTRW